MAILSFSPSPAKDSTSTVTLNKSELYALAPISGDAFWSDPDNIREVVVVYESNIGKQNKIVSFDAQLASPETSIAFSTDARDNFLIAMIVLKDYDNGELELKRSTLSSLISVQALDIELNASGTLYFAFSGTNDNDLAGFGSTGDPAIGGEFFAL